MRRPVALLFAFTLTLSGGGCDRPAETPPEVPPPPPNVLMFVGDGFGVGAWSVAREYARSTGLTTILDDAPHVGFLETHCADALVTDSAAAATAWFTGAPGKIFAVGSQEEPPQPGLFERLRAADRAHGVITTTRITHATPAPLYGRVAHRYQKNGENDLAAQLVETLPTVAIGGGRRHFVPAADGGARSDDRNLLAEAREQGAAVLEEFVSPLPVDRPVLALLADSHMPHELDRGDGPDLADLVTAAIDRLEAEGKPWFLLVEEGRIDSACHDHDGPGVARNVMRLDRAVRAALAKVDPERTLLVVTADHATASPAIHETAHPESLDIVSMSVERMEKTIFAGQGWTGTPRSLEERALPVLDEGARHTGLSAGDLDRLLTAANHYERATAIGKAVSRRFGISFLSYRDHQSSKDVHGHTADPVPVRAWGVRAADAVRLRDHATFGRWLWEVMELPVDEATADAPDSTTTPIDTPGGHG